MTVFESLFKWLSLLHGAFLSAVLQSTYGQEKLTSIETGDESQREALVMRELEGRPYSEIAQILELSASALETLLFRARRSLADELENAVTCDRAELGLSKQLDGRLSRKERKRLDDHLAECSSCARLQVTQVKQRRAFKGLALLPLPFSLMLFKGAPSASAAIGIPTIGAAGTAAVVGGGAATGGSFTLGGLALGGVAVKAAAVVAAVSVASGVGYVGTKEVQEHRNPAQKTPVTAVTPAGAKPRPASAGGAQRQAAATARGTALAKGSKRATSPTGSSRGIAAPGRSAKAGARGKLVRVRPATRAPIRSKASGKATAVPRATKSRAKATPPAVTSPQRSSTTVSPKPAPVTKTAPVPKRTTTAPGSRTPAPGELKKPR